MSANRRPPPPEPAPPASLGAGPVVQELVPAPGVLAVARALADRPHLAVLESAEFHAERGRYSYVCADPSEWHAGPFADLAAAAKSRPWRAPVPGLPPFQGGYLGLFGYGLAAEWEPTPAPRHDEFTLPNLGVGYYDRVVSFDHLQNRAWVVSARHLGRANYDLTRTPLLPPVRASGPVALAPQFPLPGRAGVTSNFSRGGYLAAVRRAVDYVHAGDCFQVNLAQRLLAPLAEHPLELYARLRAVNPAPFAGYLDLGSAQVVSASPERFMRVEPCGAISARPIKGTRPRGATAAEDAELVRDLVTNPKDRAENVMIVDLLRNDLGRVAAFGSVEVPRVCEVESFRFVHHLVSEVAARLAPGKSVWDLLKAALPGGSVTGAPKVRAMQIIAELEPTARGPYCGSLGFVGDTGAADLNILIRTFTAAGGFVQFPVGGGVVADSDPAREYEETLHKAAGLLRALQP